MNRIAVILSGLIVSCLEVRAQDTVLYQPIASVSLINTNSNFINHTELLIPFYEKLLVLKRENKGVVNILHLGDSHIQADLLTGTTRPLLQHAFGNAGQGLVFPWRAASLNDSPHIISSSSGSWVSNRITQSDAMIQPGIGGIVLKTESAGSTLSIRTVNKEYSFDRITLFFHKDFNQFNVVVKDSASRPIAFAGAFTNEPQNISRLLLPRSVNQIQLEILQSLPEQNQFTFYGMSLENQHPGVRYHSLGVNGAKYKHFMASTELLYQTQLLTPDLIIISLGSNEAADHPNIDLKFGAYADTLISELRKQNPEAVILLTTPVDFFKKKTSRNPAIQTIKNKIIDVASQKNLPYWNLYEIAGGNHAADTWKKEQLMQNDGIHFTKKGYELQGQLLFEAIIKGYNEYVLHRQ